MEIAQLKFYKTDSLGKNILIEVLYSLSFFHEYKSNFSESHQLIAHVVNDLINNIKLPKIPNLINNLKIDFLLFARKSLHRCLKEKKNHGCEFITV